MVSNNDTLFKYYDVIGIKDKNFIARFLNKKQAQLTKKWLNEEVFGYNYCNVIEKKVNYKNIDNFKSQHKHGITFSTAEEFILYLKKRLKEVFYKCEDGNLAYVKIDNFWWELDTTTPLNNATIYNLVGGRQTEWDLTKAEIVEAKDWQHLDWSGTCLYDNTLKTGWLNPEGKFFGCDYRNHSSQANYVHGKRERDLELEGWIKLTYYWSDEKKLIALIGRDKNHEVIIPTEKQWQYLSNNRDISNLSTIERAIKRNFEKEL